MKKENEGRDPLYWIKRRAKIAFWHNIGPIAAVTLVLLAFLVTGILEVNL